MFEDVINSINFSDSFEGEEADFSGLKCKIFPFSKLNFNEIKNTSKGTMAFVDGGNSELLKAPNFSLQLCRVAYCLFENGERKKQERKEFFVFVNVVNGKFIVKTFGDGLSANLNTTFDLNDEHFKIGKSQGTPSSVVLAIRRFAELDLASNIDADVIVLDGSLQQSYSFENDFMKKLKDKTLVGFCKTSSLLTKKGNSVIALMNMQKGKFAYRPVAELFDDTYSANICFARLHENSKYVFKLDFNKEINGDVLALLAENSKDPVFLGYPYGLVLVDRFARVSNEEANYVSTKLISKIKNEELLRYLNALNAHDVLDKI